VAILCPDLAALLLNLNPSLAVLSAPTLPWPLPVLLWPYFDPILLPCCFNPNPHETAPLATRCNANHTLEKAASLVLLWPYFDPILLPCCFNPNPHETPPLATRCNANHTMEKAASLVLLWPYFASVLLLCCFNLNPNQTSRLAKHCENTALPWGKQHRLCCCGHTLTQSCCFAAVLP
jgi:hypothetical protein